MRVDVHTHIFTLRAILNREAIRVIGQRLRDKNVPGWLSWIAYINWNASERAARAESP